MDFGNAAGRVESALFVGRAEPLARLVALVEEAAKAPRIVVIAGQAGAGKSALARELLRRLPRQRAIWLSGERIAPNVEAFRAALTTQSGGGLEELGRRDGVDLLVIDAYERVRSIERWLFDDALPRAGARLCVIVTSRESLRARKQGTLSAVTHELALPPLDGAEVRDYLRRRGVPEDAEDTIVAYAAGHALALSLIADRYALDRGYRFEARAARDLVASLVAEFARDAPSLEHESALYALAVPSALDEPLLGAMLGLPAASATRMFAWLRALTFVEHDADGLIPHALVRAVLYDDLTQRNPERLRRMMEGALELLLERIGLMEPLRAPTGLMRALYMRRRASPILDPLHFEHLAQCDYRPIGATSIDSLAAIVERWEGAASAARFREAVAHDPGFAFGVHGANGEAIALNVFVAIGAAPEELVRGDVVLERARSLWRELEPDAQWELAIARWRMTAEGYQALGPAMQAVLTGGPFITSLRAPRVRWVLFAASPPEEWEPLAEPYGLSIVGRISSRDRVYTLALADTHALVGGPCTARETARRLTRMHLRNLAALNDVPPSSAPPPVGLTERQRAVLAVLLAGKSNKEIAVALRCAESTVEFHVTSLLRKNNVTSRAELIAKVLARS